MNWKFWQRDRPGLAEEPQAEQESLKGGEPMAQELEPEAQTEIPEAPPINLLNPPDELMPGDESPAAEALDLLNVEEEVVRELEKACGVAATSRGNPFAIGVTVAEILSWQRNAVAEKTMVARAIRAADALECIYEGTISDRKAAAQGKGALMTRVPQLRELGQEASRQAELPQPEPGALAPPEEPQPTPPPEELEPEPSDEAEQGAEAEPNLEAEMAESRRILGEGE